MRLADSIDALLPQTQCTKCGFAGCRPYAEAIANGEAAINQCPPGGAAGIEALARLLDRAVQPLNPANGVERAPLVALIDEAVCIGCTKCIQACPVDAIVGAAKLMHAVIADECSGCELCIAPCPVDCISMVDARGAQAVSERATQYRGRYDARRVRLARDEREHAEKMRARTEAALAAPSAAADDPVAAALARAAAKRAARGSQPS